MSTSPRRHAVRNALIVLVLIGGAALQYAYTSTNHPSTLLKARALIYGIVGVLAFIGLAFAGIERLKLYRASGRRPR